MAEIFSITVKRQIIVAVIPGVKDAETKELGITLKPTKSEKFPNGEKAQELFAMAEAFLDKNLGKPKEIA